MLKTRNPIHKEIQQLLSGARAILITAHEEPDGDSIGSQLALRRLAMTMGKKATVINRGKIPAKYRFLPDIDQIQDIEHYGGGEAYDLAVVLECPLPVRTGGVERLIGKGTKVINIDHHPDNQPFGDINYLDVKASSVGEILSEFLFDVEMAIDGEVATLLYAAILTDTGRFRYRSTARRTLEIAGRLIEAGADPRDICDQIYFSLPPSTLRLTGSVLSGMEYHAEGRICLMSLDRRHLENSGADLSEADGLTDYSLFGRGVLIGGLLKEVGASRTKISLRSRNRLDVSHVAHKYGGGGHYNAAGCTVELPLEKARTTILADLKELLNGSV